MDLVSSIIATMDKQNLNRMIKDKPKTHSVSSGKIKIY